MIHSSFFRSRSLVLSVIIFNLVFFSSLALADTIDASFSGVYPKGFFETTAGNYVIITSTTIVAAVATFYFSPAAGSAILAKAPLWMTTVASTVGQIAGYGSGATAAGLAILGGGTIANGGFGMAGGVAVLEFVSDLGSGILVDRAYSLMDTKSDKTFLCDTLAFPASLELPPIGREQIKYYAKELKIHEIKGDVSSNQYKSTRQALERELESVNYNTKKVDLESIIVRAVYNFNNSTKDSDQVLHKDISFLRKNSSNSGFLDFMEGIANFQRSQTSNGVTLLKKAINSDSRELKPYYWLIVHYRDNGEFSKALELANLGINNLSKQRFPLYWEAAKLYYRTKQYSLAAQRFEDAFNDIDDPDVKAEAAHMIAVSHWNLGDYPQANKWHDDSIKIINSTKKESKSGKRSSELTENLQFMHKLWEDEKNGLNGQIGEITLNESRLGSFKNRCK